MHRNIAVRDINVSKDETDRLEEEAQRLEEQLASIRELRGGGAAPSRAAVEPHDGANEPLENEATESTAAPRWRGACDSAEDPPVDDAEVAESDALAARMLGAILDSEPRPLQESRAGSERPRVRRAGEFGSIETFLGDLNLGRFATLFHERGLDTAEAIASLDPRQFRALGIDNKSAMRLRIGIAELRSFGVAVAPAPPLRVDVAETRQAAVLVRPAAAVAVRPLARAAAPSGRPPVAAAVRRPSAGRNPGSSATGAAAAGRPRLLQGDALPRARSNSLRRHPPVARVW